MEEVDDDTIGEKEPTEYEMKDEVSGDLREVFP